MEPLVKQFNYDDYRLNTEIENIIRRINLLQPRKPDYDSGWFAIGQGQHIVKIHNLNTTDVHIELHFKDNTTGSGINNIGYGSFQLTTGAYRGAFWRNLTTTSIRIYRETADPWADEVRILMWKI